MQIIQAPSDIKAAIENENRDADIANAVAKIDFLCLLDGVPVETNEQEMEGMTHE